MTFNVRQKGNQDIAYLYVQNEIAANALWFMLKTLGFPVGNKVYTNKTGRRWIQITKTIARKETA